MPVHSVNTRKHPCANSYRRVNAFRCLHQFDPTVQQNVGQGIVDLVKVVDEEHKHKKPTHVLPPYNQQPTNHNNNQPQPTTTTTNHNHPTTPTAPPYHTAVAVLHQPTLHLQTTFTPECVATEEETP